MGVSDLVMKNPCFPAGTVGNFQCKCQKKKMWRKHKGMRRTLYSIHTDTIHYSLALCLMGADWLESVPISAYMASAPIQICRIALKLREVRGCNYHLVNLPKYYASA